MHRNQIISFILSLSLPLSAIADTKDFLWRKSLIFGYGITDATQNQNVNLADTPSPGLVNRYISNSTLYGSTLLGFALDKEFITQLHNGSLFAGAEIDYLRNQYVNGVVEPMINVSPDFDILKYSYDIHSVVLQAIGKYVKHDLLSHIDGYLQAGIGAAINRLSDYNEYPAGNSSAAPMLSPYGNRDTLNPALSAGVGITYKLGTYDAYLSFGYRYFYTGRGRLDKSAIQQTNSSIILSPISYQFLVISLTI
jgi:hypothetical protein